MRIIVLGYIVRGPLAGLAWHHLQYVLGLGRLGYDVYFMEDSDDYPSCYDPERYVVDTDPAYGLRFIASAFDRLGLGARWAYFDAHAGSWKGPAAERAVRLCEGADLLLDVSGVNPMREWYHAIPRRVLIDTDPAFTQIRHLTDCAARERAAQHTAFFSFAENIRSPQACVPRDGFDWYPTRQPVVLDAWAVTPGKPDGAFTTVMQWDSYAARDYAGSHYGVKSESFEPYVNLPRETTEQLELALGSGSSPGPRLRAQGWRIEDPQRVTRDPWVYQEYIRASKGEFTVAKHGYVVSRSGWFSERSLAYLASGRPVVTQNTGFDTWLPCGSGVVDFDSPVAALDALKRVSADYERHCRAAREIAASFFDSDEVLTSLLERVHSHAARTTNAPETW
jgi:hypothetical protein